MTCREEGKKKGLIGSKDLFLPRVLLPLLAGRNVSSLRHTRTGRHKTHRQFHGRCRKMVHLSSVRIKMGILKLLKHQYRQAAKVFVLYFPHSMKLSTAGM